ncbi:MAG: thioredoxin family protein, partial [Anaerolineales bacterium]
LRFVPKPGEWMIALKQLMGFFLMATVAALVWLFGQQTGVDGVGKLLAALLLIALAAWAYGRAHAPTRSRRGRVAGSAVAALLLAIGFAVGWRGAASTRGAEERVSATAQGLAWEAYTAHRLAEARAEGSPVFIDFTAAWCLTCQVNERVALAHGEVVSRFRREGIVALRADWTRRDDQITRALAAYGRQGVPVYVLYGREPETAPELLPELLTPGIVLAAIDKTLGPARLTESRSPAQNPLGGL